MKYHGSFLSLGFMVVEGEGGVMGVPGKVFGSCLSAVGGGRVATGPFTSGGIKAVKFTNNV